MVDPEFANEAMEFFQSNKTNFESTSQIDKKITDGTSEIWNGSLSTLKNNDIEDKINLILSIFGEKRPDIGYNFGMSHIAAVLLNIFKVEGDSFVMFSHIIEFIYPGGYFDSDNRRMGKHIELRIFELMAEKLRPRLMNTLKAVFNPKGKSTKEIDTTPFVSTVKRIGDVWFSTLFSTSVAYPDLIRIWDNMLIFGFGFIEKFALVLLSKHEGSLKNSVKRETKSLGVGPTVDSLILAGNTSKNKVNSKAEKMPIEKLLKKVHTKASYKALKRSAFINQAETLESNSLERLHKLRQSKVVLRGKGITFSYSQSIDAFNALDSIETNQNITRSQFLSSISKFKWPTETAINIFSTFDQKGNDIVSSTHLKGALAVLAEGLLEQKLELIFIAFDKDKSGALDPTEVIDMMTSIENLLDERSSNFQKNSSSLYACMDRNQDGKISLSEFIKSAKSDPGCESIISYINAIESEESNNSKLAGMINADEDGIYSDVHSPMKRSVAGSSISENDPEEMGQMYEEDFEENEEDSPESYETRGNSLKNNSRLASSGNKEHFSAFKTSSYSNTLESEEEFRTPQLKPKISIKKHANIEFPTPENSEKETKRGGCDRLCTRDGCLIF